MPELPDVEVFRRTVARTSLKLPVTALEVRDPTMLHGVTGSALGRRLEGRALTRTRRHGKHLVVDVEGGDVVALHLGMTGFPATGEGEAPAPGHVRVVLHFEDGHWLALVDQRRLGHVALASSLEQYVEREGLGPDVLSLGPAALRDQLAGPRGGLKTTLTDQATLAGLGNIYADEVLFQARLDPRTAVSSLTGADHRWLHRQLRRVLELAITRRADPDRLPRGWLLPNREQGRRCPKSRGVIEAYRAGGRRGYWCPACQG